MGNRSKYIFFKEDIQIANIHTKMLNIISYEVTVNENHNEIPPTRMSIIKKTDNKKC